MTKVERNLKVEARKGRLHSHARLSGFGFRISFGLRHSSFVIPRRWRGGFTLIELILVMAILTIAVSLTAPTLSHFFAGRALDSEARRLLALTRNGQSRAVSEGIPIELWVDTEERTYGMEAEVSSRSGGAKKDPRAVQFALDRDVKIEVPSLLVAKPAVVRSSATPVSTASVPPVAARHPNLPTIRFLPDGFVSDQSPQTLHLIDREGASLWLAVARNRLNYEIRSQVN